MVLTKSAYNQLLNCSKVPPEIGGILGSTNKVVNEVVIDKGISTANDCVYIPDIYQLNKIISKWTKFGITFSGMFHTHADQWPTFSADDIEYISMILMSMPITVNELYFPIVFPGKMIKSHIARKQGGSVSIIEDSILIKENEEFDKAYEKG